MNAKKEWELTQGMMMGTFDEENWKTINGTHVLIGEGGEIKGGPAALRNYKKGEKSSKKSEAKSEPKGAKSMNYKEMEKEVIENNNRLREIQKKGDKATKAERQEERELIQRSHELKTEMDDRWNKAEGKAAPKATKKTTEKKSGSSEKSYSRNKKDAFNHVVKKDFHFDDLKYKNSDDYDFFDNDRGSLSVGAIEDALSKAYEAGVQKARTSKKGSITSAQIERDVKKNTKEWVGFSLEDKNRDGYDYWSNERGSFSNYDLSHALQSMYGQGYSSGDHISTDSAAEIALVMDMLTGDYDPDQPRDEKGMWTSTGGSAYNSAEVSGGPEYHGKVGKVKYRDLEFDVDENGNVKSGPKELLEGLKHPKEPGKDLKQGDLVVYAPKWRSPGEEKYISVILEERGDKLLLGSLNTRLTLGSTESVSREMVQSVGYNAGVSEEWEKTNDPA